MIMIMETWQKNVKKSYFSQKINGMRRTNQLVTKPNNSNFKMRRSLPSKDLTIGCIMKLLATNDQSKKM